MPKSNDFILKGGRKKIRGRIYQKGLSLLLIIALLLTQTIHITPVYGDPEKTKVNLVVLLVEKSIDDNSGLYEGLPSSPTTTLSARINRYAMDIQNRLAETRVSILTIDNNEDPYRISQVLEKLYFEGDSNSNEINNLEGVVLIGSIPLPTVQKGNATYKSLFPYTDFIDKQFLYDPVTKIFTEYDNATERKPEIWHGVIQPPVGGEEGNKLLALYFDKNHAFYEGSDGYSEFDTSVFFADLIHEPNKLQEDRLNSYNAFLGHMEDIAYLRFNKKLAQEISDIVQGDIAAEMTNSNANVEIPDTQDQFAKVPDIYTREIILRLISRFVQLFGDYPSTIQKWISASGRWGEKDIDTFFKLITAKDEFTLRILQRANDVLEGKTDAIAQSMQQDIDIATGARFISNKPWEPTEHLHNYINGKNAEEITTAAECSIYRGSSGTGSYAQQVEANRVYYPVDNKNKNDRNYNDIEDCKPYGGCCGKNINYINGNLSPSPKCNVNDAIKPVFDLRGTLKRDGVNDYTACDVENYPETKDSKYEHYAKVSDSDTKKIPSIIYHKEPTGETIQKQLMGKVAQTLPIDQPRYVDFKNKDGLYQRIDYLNVFSIIQDQCLSKESCQQALENYLSESNDEMNRQIYTTNVATFRSYMSTRTDREGESFNGDFNQWEQQMLSFLQSRSQSSYDTAHRYKYFIEYYRKYNAGELDYENDLGSITTSLFHDAALHESHALNTLSSFVRNHGDTVTVIDPLEGSSEQYVFTTDMFIDDGIYLQTLKEIIPLEDIVDALYWRYRTIPEKYLYIFQNYLSIQQLTDSGNYNDIYPTKKKGYESMYLAARGEKDHLTFTIPSSSSIEDPLFDDLNNQLSIIQTQDKIHKATQNTGRGQNLNMEDSCGGWDGVEIFKWFSAIQCWLKNLLPPKLQMEGDGEGDTVDFTQEDQETFNNPMGGNGNNNYSSPSNTNSDNENENNSSSEEPHIESVQITSSLDSLNLFDQEGATITATVLDQNGEAYIPSEEIPATFVAVQNEPIVEFSQEQVPLGTGIATTTLRPLQAGRTTIYARAGNVSSPPLAIEVYDRKTQVTLSFQDNEGEETTGTFIPARSIVTGDVEIVDLNGTLVPVNGSINFSITKKSDGVTAAFVSSSSSILKDGKASIQLDVGQKAGTFILETTVSAGQETASPYRQEITIIGGKASLLVLSSESTTLMKDIPSQAKLSVYDRDGNLSSGNYDVSFYINEMGVIEDITDKNPNLEGINTTIEGGTEIPFTLRGLQAGTLNIKARIDGITEDTTLSLAVRDDLKASFYLGGDTIRAGSSPPIPLTISVVDPAGTSVDWSGGISTELSHAIATLSPNTIHILHGTGTGQLLVGTMAGETSLSASSFPCDPFTVHIASDQAARIQVHSSKNRLQADGKDQAIVTVSVLDQYDNPVTDYDNEINLQLTDATTSYGTLEYTNINAQNGQADFQVTSTLIPGEVHLIATGIGIPPRSIPGENGEMETVNVVGTLSIPTDIYIGSDIIKNTSFNALYSTVLGNAAGSIQEKNYIGGWMLFNKGKMQSVTTLITEPYQQKILASVTPQGIIIPEGSNEWNIQPTVIPHQELPLEIQLIEKNIGETLTSIWIEPPKDSTHEIVDQVNTPQTSGIYLADADTNDTIELQENGTDILLTQGDRIFLTLSQEGYIFLDPTLIMDLSSTGNGSYTFDISLQGTPVATIRYNLPDIQVKIAASSDTIDTVSSKGPGVYVKLVSNDFILAQRGNIIILTKEGEIEKIDEPFMTVEDILEEEGIGWRGDFKNELLFAAGNSVGESTKNYASSVMINLGDPIVSLPKTNQTGILGYTTDMGKLLTSYQGKRINELVPIDYNKDGQQDLFVVFDSGYINLLQNFNNGQDWKDMGAILYVQDGITSIVKGDTNGDGWEDVLIITKDGKIALFVNNGGAFEREDISLDVQGRITSVKMADMDHDGNLDLTTSDDSGDIKIFYGSSENMWQDAPVLIDNVGISATDENLNHETAVYFEGLPLRDPNNLDDADKFVQIPYDTTELNTNGDNDDTLSVITGEANEASEYADAIESGAVENGNANGSGASDSKDFMKLDLVTSLRSEKHVKDLNGGSVQLNDDLQYTITITNAGSSITDMAIADYVPDIATMQNTSITCENCGDHFVVLNQAHSDYPLMIGHIVLPSGSTVTVTYKATVIQLPVIALEVGDFEHGEDPYLDIYARDASGSNAVSVLYSSVAARQYEKSIHDATLEPPDELKKQYKDENNNGIPDQLEKDTDGDGTPDFANDYMNNRLEDDDNDGIPNAWDEYGDSGGSSGDDLIGMSNDLESTVDSFFNGLCSSSGGCINTPINIAFLSPGYFTIPSFSSSGSGILGTSIEITPKKTTLDKGTPIFGIMPNPSYVCSGSSCWGTSTLRFYLSPTLTGGLGIALCWNNYNAGMVEVPANPAVSNCVWFAIPLLDMIAGDTCSQINASMNQMMSAGKISLGSGGQGVFKVGFSLRGGRSSSQFTYNNGTFNLSADTTKNKNIPSFPNFIMNWVNAELQEIQKKLTSLPTVYLILPNFKGVFNVPEGLKVKSIGDAWDYLTSLPFVNVRYQDVVVKYPKISKERFDQLKEYYTQWIKNAEKEVTNYDDTIADNLLRVQILRGFINRVKSNIQTMESYKDFERYIQMFSRWKTVLIRQVLSYLDKIADALGGYYLRNKLRAIKWYELYLICKNILGVWQAIYDLFKGYREDCTTCNNDRGNAYHWNMSAASFLPSPPIIQFPKWPDIVIDASNINAVINIGIPNPRLIPQEIIIPRLPSFRLPDISLTANLDTTIPQLPRLPNLSSLFPKLPQLPIPKLPDIPPPPKLPKLFSFIKTIVKILKLVLKIWCLYKQGWPLAQEWELKHKIEIKTQRSGFLPLDFISLSFPVPSFAFVDQIRVDAYVNFKFNVTTLVDIVRNFANSINTIQTNLLYGITKGVQGNMPRMPRSQNINLPGNTQLNSLYEELQQLISSLNSEGTELVTVDEMKRLLTDQLATLSEENINTSNIQKNIRQALDVPLPFNFQPGENKNNTALRHQLYSLLHDNLQDEQYISQARASQKDLLAVQELQHLFITDQTVLAAQQSIPNGTVIRERTFSNVAPLPSENRENPTSKKLLLAQTDGSSSASSLETPSVSLEGLYLYNDTLQIYEKLIAYEEESGNNTALALTDIDNDGDEDVLYTLGSDIYMKGNHKNASAEGVHFTTAPAIQKLTDIDINMESINYIDISPQTNKVTISWLPGRTADVIGYRLLLKKVINRFDLEKVKTFNETTNVYYFSTKENQSTMESFIPQDPKNINSFVELLEQDNPSAIIELPSGNYYGKMEGILQDGSFGTLNDIHLLAPQKYGDKTSPVAIVEGGNTKEVPILQTLTLNASLSQDTAGKIDKYYWDLDPTRDSNGDGLMTNDPDYYNDLGATNDSLLPPEESAMNDPVITLGPFTEPGEKRIVLNVEDEAGNIGQTEVIIHIYVPQLKIDIASTARQTIEGHTERPTDSEPISIIRERNGTLKVLKTPSADSNGKYITDQSGQYKISDFNTEKGLVVKDEEGNIIATINEDTGRITVIDPSYSIEVVPTTNNAPTTMLLKKGSATIVELTIVSDPNIDVEISSVPPTSDFKAVSVIDKDSNDMIIAAPLPETTSSYPGGAVIYNTATHSLVSMVGTNGSVVLLDHALSVDLKPGEDPTPVIYEVHNGTTLLFDIYIPRSSPLTIH